MPYLKTPMTFKLLGRSPYISLWLGLLAPDGTLQQSSVSDGQNEYPISGSYDAAAGVIKFNDAKFPV